MNQKKLLWTVAQIVGVAGIAAFITNYENNNSDEATSNGRLGKSLTMWAVGFAISVAGGVAALGTVTGLLAVLGSVSLAIIVLGLFLGAGSDAKQKAQKAYNDADLAWDVFAQSDKEESADEPVAKGDEGVEILEEDDSDESPIEVDVDGDDPVPA